MAPEDTVHRHSDPRDRRQLDEYVIGQDVPRKSSRSPFITITSGLFTAKSGGEIEIDKSNILLIGPTGAARHCWLGLWPAF